MTPAAHLQDVSSSEAEDVVIFVEREAAEVVNPLPIDLEGRLTAARTRLAAWPAAAAAGACSQANLERPPTQPSSNACVGFLFDDLIAILIGGSN